MIRIQTKQTQWKKHKFPYFPPKEICRKYTVYIYCTGPHRGQGRISRVAENFTLMSYKSCRVKVIEFPRHFLNITLSRSLFFLQWESSHQSSAAYNVKICAIKTLFWHWTWSKRKLEVGEAFARGIPSINWYSELLQLTLAHDVYNCFLPTLILLHPS